MPNAYSKAHLSTSEEPSQPETSQDCSAIFSALESPHVSPGTLGDSLLSYTDIWREGKIIDAVFWLTVGSCLLTAELFYLQLTILAFYLQLELFWLQLELFCLQLELFFAYNGKVRLIRALSDCKQRGLTVSKKTLTVSNKASPENDPRERKVKKFQWRRHLQLADFWRIHDPLSSFCSGSAVTFLERDGTRERVLHQPCPLDWESPLRIPVSP